MELNSSPFSYATLYCEEEHNHWDKVDTIQNTNKPFLEQDLFWDDEEYLSYLLSKEQKNELYNSLAKNPSLAKARCGAVEWMLKVVGYYSFSALTAVLAVSYLDRFLYIFQSHNQSWMSQLAAVACLSLAAKVEETHVPLLLDLQVEQSKYVFDSKTIQRMEILVLSTLEWKMNPVTPLPFLDCIARRLALKSHLCSEFIRKCEFLLISLVSDCKFMCYLPSAMATATMVYVIKSFEPFNGLDYPDQLVEILGINKGIVEECSKQIQVHFQSSNKRKSGCLP